MGKRKPVVVACPDNYWRWATWDIQLSPTSDAYFILSYDLAPLDRGFKLVFTRLENKHWFVEFLFWSLELKCIRSSVTLVDEKYKEWNQQ